MNGIERMGRLLKRQPVDRIGLFEHFWGDTRQAWAAAGAIREDEDLAEHFGFDMTGAACFNLVADIDYEPEISEETEETLVRRDGNGALFRVHKQHASTPEHLGFDVKDRATWEELARPLLIPDPQRIDFARYREAREAARQAGRFFCWTGPHAFELMKNVTGHINMLMGMLDDPAWVADMAMTYARLHIGLQETLFDQEGWPDGIWYNEDMGFKAKPFMSPQLYRELVQPAHKLTIDFAKSHNLPVIMHSCGFVEALVPYMVEAGIDCLQAMEVKAGMDVRRLFKQYGEVLSFMGGLDVRAICSNDRAEIDAELEAKVPLVMQGNGYILHSDHSIPNTVDYASYRYFVERGLELGTFK